MRKLLLSAVCVLAISAAVAGGASGPPNVVRSVFGRVGAVVAAANDYTIAQISGLGANVATALGNGAGAASGVALYGAATPGNTSSSSGQAAGFVGEVLSVSATSQAIANSTQTNVATLSVTAGHWLCTGWLSTNPAGTTTQTFVASAVSTSSASFGTGLGTFQAPFAAAGGAGVNAEFGPVYYNFTTTTPVYNVQFIVYAVSTLTTNGGIQCLRIW